MIATVGPARHRASLPIARVLAACHVLAALALAPARATSAEGLGELLDGAPRRKREDPDYRARVEKAALRMPAYRSFVTAAQVDDLVAYLRAASGQILPDEALAQRGAELASDLGCFACHGPLGAGGVRNPGSFKGYVPGFWGPDFDDLVRSEDELRSWIARGELARVAEHPIGGRFFKRQAIRMPAFQRFVPEMDLDALAAYVRWIRAGTWRPLIR